MTLAECIEIHHAAQPEPAASGVTPKGIAVIAIYQIRRALIDMDPADREEVRTMVADMLSDDRARVIYGAHHQR